MADLFLTCYIGAAVFPSFKAITAAQHFEGFDPEGFSLWFCDYKYPEENTVNYIVMNKVSCSAPL